MAWAILIVAIVTLIVTSTALWVALHERSANQHQRRREGTAELEPRGTNLYENTNAPHGWQVTIYLHNKGPAIAHHVTAWLAAEHGAPLNRSNRNDSVYPGESHNMGLDLPADPTVPMNVWLGWQDVRGEQERDTGRLSPPPPPQPEEPD